MAANKVTFLERYANLFGVLYRHQARQYPRRLNLLKNVAQRELAPPRATDLPAIQQQFFQLFKAIETKQYRNLTLREAAVYGAVGLEIIFWFFVGEIIGRRYIIGYLVPGNYVSKETRAKVKAAHES